MANAPDGLDEADILRLYRQVRRIRRVEEETARIYPSDKIKSPVHLAIGQEAVSVGVCDVLRSDDVAGGTYRGHAVYLAKGGNLNAMMAEMFGKAGGCAGGKGGSMHLVDMTANVLGTSAVVGTNIPVVTGFALAHKRRGRGQVAVAFFGDGATEEGVFYESLNFAALHKLPVLFVCENNGLAIHEPIAKRWANEDLCGRVRGFGIPAHHIPDGDIFAIRRTAAAAVARIREGLGPEFMECKIHRWREHVGPDEDYDAGYRSREEAKPWFERDVVAVLAAKAPEAERRRIDAEIETEIAAAIRFAENSPFPNSDDELHAHVFAD
jgi:pyruvate dehydrogenase E1 component alpha subunit